MNTKVQNASPVETENASNTYLDVTYGNKPFTDYPTLLTKYLTAKYFIKKNSRLLDLGCGRGEFLRGFIKQDMVGFGIDQADTAREICPTGTIVVGNLEDRLPIADNFLIVFLANLL